VRVLLLEDEPDIASLISYHLEELGFSVDAVTEGERALQLATEQQFKLIIVDLMLPGLDGLSACRILRERKVMSPVLILTARAEAEDAALGIPVRADDFLRKPFDISDFLVRATSLMGHAEAIGAEQQVDRTIINCGSLMIDSVMREVTVDGTVILMTPREYDLLVYLARNPSSAFDASYIMRHVWGYEHGFGSTVVEAHIERINWLLSEAGFLSQPIQRLQGGVYRLTHPGDDSGRDTK
jgi:DNA-binding response OmpR family regulator